VGNNQTSANDMENEMISFEEIRRKYNDDSLHADIVTYVRPLLAEIDKLQKELGISKAYIPIFPRVEPNND